MEDFSKLETYRVFVSREPGIRVHKDRGFENARSFDFGPLQFRVPPPYRFPRPTDIKTARLKLKEYIAEKDQRFKELGGFLASHGLELSGETDAVSDLTRFYAHHVFCNENRDDLHPMWIGFAWSYALFLGEEMIMRGKARGLKRRWQVKDVSLSKWGEPPRFVIGVGGHRSVLHNVRPEQTLIGLGRFMLKRRQDQTEFGPKVPDPLSRLTSLMERDLEWGD